MDQLPKLDVDSKLNILYMSENLGTNACSEEDDNENVIWLDDTQRKVEEDDKDCNRNRNKDNTSNNFSDTKIADNNTRRRSSFFLERRRSSGSKRHKMIYEPTYRMEPKPNCYFIWYKVRNVVQRLVQPLFDDFKYDGKAGSGISKLICNKVMVAIRRKFDWPRYRYICHVVVVQLNRQGILIGDRSLWNTAHDSCCTVVMKTKEAVCVITVHGIYQE